MILLMGMEGLEVAVIDRWRIVYPERSPHELPARSTGALLAYRVVVSYRHRFLQTALLRATVGDGSPAVFEVETIVRTDSTELSTATPHDVELVLNHTNDGTALMSVLGDGALEGAVAAFAPEDVDGVMDDVVAALHRVADEPQTFAGGAGSPGFGPLMVELARIGRNLHDLLFGRFHRLPQGCRPRLRDAPRISVLSTRPTAAAPLELVYDRPLDDAIDDEKPQWCPDASAHLAAGACPGTCPGSASGLLVCPFGFWGVRKVVERHARTGREEPWTRVALAVPPDVERHRVALTDVLPPPCGRTTTTSRPGQARATGSETSRSPERGASSRGSCGSAVGRVGHRGCSYW
jgi:hypothetical protein